MIRPNMVYLPIYKKPWEISENLDIIVPVGYNTLVIDSIPLPYQSGEYSHYKRFMNDKIDRLDREFRKGWNAMEKKNILTYEGLQKLENELQDLKLVKRKEIAQKIKEAREQGDLSDRKSVV